MYQQSAQVISRGLGFYSISRIIGMHSDSRVPEYSLWSCCGYNNFPFIFISRYPIGNPMEYAECCTTLCPMIRPLHCLYDRRNNLPLQLTIWPNLISNHLNLTQHRPCFHTPIHHSCASVNQTFLMQLNEGSPNALT